MAALPVAVPALKGGGCSRVLMAQLKTSTQRRRLKAVPSTGQPLLGEGVREPTCASMGADALRTCMASNRQEVVAFETTKSCQEARTSASTTTATATSALRQESTAFFQHVPFTSHIRLSDAAATVV